MATVTWTGAGDIGTTKFWNTAGNWSSLTVPGTTDTAMVTLSGSGVSLTSTLDMQGATIGSAYFFGGSTVNYLAHSLTATVVGLQGNVALANFGVLDTGSAYVTNANTIRGTLEASGQVAVGSAASGNLLITGSDGAKLLANSLLVGGNAGVQGTVNDVGNGITITSAATIGASGNGALTIVSSGNGAIGGNLLAGVSSGAVGSVYVNNAHLAVYGNAYIGEAGTANLTAGASSNLLVGAGSAAGIVFVGSHGKVLVDNAQGMTANAVIMSPGAQLTMISNSSAIYLQGASDPAVAVAPVELVVDGLASLYNDSGVIGPGYGATSGLVAVGDGGSGTLNLTTASLKAQYTEIGVKAGDVGVLALNAGGNLHDIGASGAGGLYVGVAGTGVATINLGQVQDTGNAAVGVSAGGVGVVIVEGTNIATGTAGYWNTRTLDVGVRGSGTLLVGGGAVAGGTANVYGMMLGVSAGGSGAVTVQNSGSINDQGSLWVGEAGNGSLEIDNGKISMLGALVAGDAAGSHGTINIASAAATLSTYGTIGLGNAGSGALLVGAGSQLIVSTLVELGALSTGAGSLVVNGTMVINSGSLLAGVDGTGSVTIGSTGLLNDQGTMEIGAAGTGSGSVSMLGGTLSPASITLGSGGTIVGRGDITWAHSSDNEGLIEASGGTLTLDATAVVGGAGTLAVAPNAQLDVASVASPQLVLFEPGAGNETLGLMVPLAMGGTIKGFSTTTTIDLLSVAHTLSQTVTYDTASHVLTVSDGPSVEAMLTFDASNTFTSFALKADTGGIGTDIVACYAEGTRVLTWRGEVEVERLQVGDLLLTMSGALRPIQWIGRRSYAARFAETNAHLHPVRVRQDALAPGLPRRDLLLSPLHAILVDGVLAPVGALVNGSTIARERAPGDVTYLHIELASHDIILAEGLPSETFIDEGSRGMFQNSHEYVAPEGGAPAPISCRPRAIFGPALDAIRARLGEEPATHAAGPLRGTLERADRFRVEGWCTDAAGGPVTIEIWADGERVAAAQAASYRTDLDRAGLRDGACAFIHDFQPPLPETTSNITVCRAGDRALVPGSSWPDARAA